MEGRSRTILGPCVTSHMDRWSLGLWRKLLWLLLLHALLVAGTVSSSRKAEGNLEQHAFSDSEYKFNMGDGYVFFEVTEPDQLRYTFKINPAPFAPDWNTSYAGIGLVPSDPPCGCGSFFNAESVEGKIALIDRGECSFVSKALKAKEAGAVGAVIADSDLSNDDLYIIMQDDTTEREVDIPTGFLLGKNGLIIKNTLYKLGLEEAVINIPINITSIPIHKLKQPPWIVW